MNWIKENKFLTGYLIVMVIGLGVLGFEVFSASGAYDDAQGVYQKQAGEWDRLRKLVPFPSQKNLDQYEDQKKEAAKRITEFQVDLAKKEFPLDPMSPENFQDKLKEAVTNVRKRAAEASPAVRLPDKFFLGFEKYETTPPTPDAAAPLGRELKAINWIVDQYIDNGVLEIVSLVRAELPEEKAGAGRGEERGGPGGRGRPGGGGGSGGPGNRGGGPGGPGGGRAAREDLVQYYSFDLDAICKQPRLQSLLDTITGTQAPQFYVIRQIKIGNEQEKGPSRATPVPVQTATGQPAATSNTIFIAGEEKLDASLRIDIVDFSPPTEPSAGSDKSTPTPK